MINPDFIGCVEHNEKGEITAAMQLSAEVFKNTVEGKPNIVIGFGRYFTHYVKDGELLERPNQETKLVGNELQDLPVPCTIKINDQEYPCNESSAEISFDIPGSFQITVSAWPYQDKEFTYEN